MAFRGVVVNVFQHHDGVIHDHADAHGDTAQAHHVHGQIPGIHQHEHQQDAHGHGDGDGHGGAPAAQEQKHDDRRQQHAQDDVGQSRFHRQVDKVGGQVGQGVMDVAVFLGQLLHPRRHGFGRLGFVGAGLLGNLQQDALFAVHLRNGVLFRGLQLHFRHIAQPQSSAGGQRDEHIRHVLHAAELGVRTDRQSLGAVLQVTAGIEQILRHQELGDIRIGQAETGCAGRVDLHRDLLRHAAADGNGGHAVDTLQRRRDHVLCQFLQLGQVIAHQRHHCRRQQVADVHIHDNGINGALRQAQRAELFPQLGRRDVQVRPFGVGDLDLTHTVGGRGGHAFHTGDGHDGRLQRASHQLFHIAGGRAVVVAHNDCHGRFHIRQQRHLQLRGEYHAEHRDHDNGQNGRYPVFDTKSGQTHGVQPSTIRTASPSAR